MILVEIYPDSADEYRWRAKDNANGKVLADSGEGYKNLVDIEAILKRLFGPDGNVGLNIQNRSGETWSARWLR